MSGLNELEQILLYWGIAKHLGRNLICQTDMTASAASFETGSGKRCTAQNIIQHLPRGRLVNIMFLFDKQRMR